MIPWPLCLAAAAFGLAVGYVAGIIDERSFQAEREAKARRRRMRTHPASRRLVTLPGGEEGA